MKIISRKIAMERGLSRYFTGVPCTKNHVSERLVANGTCIACHKETRRRNYEENPHKYHANAAKRRAQRNQATPSWLSKEQLAEIDSLYKLSVLSSVVTGIKYHVDHTIPLIHDLVCGLHVPWNLRVITESDNLSKSNKLISLQPLAQAT